MTPNCAGCILLPVLFSFALGAAPLTPPPEGAVAVGAQHSLWLKPDGSVWAWGANFAGQLGDGSYLRRTAPVPVVELSSIVAIVAGDHWSMALRSDGTVWSWGSHNMADYRSPGWKGTPSLLFSLPGTIAVAGNPTSGRAITGDGLVWEWAGDGTGRATLRQLTGVSEMAAVVSGTGHFVLLRRDGTVWTSGSNLSGQLGDGTTTTRSELIQVPGLAGIAAVAAGRSHTVALKADGSVLAWGDGRLYQIGDGIWANHTSPVQIAGLAQIQRIVAGGDGTVAVETGGRVWQWGQAAYGEFSRGGFRQTPTEQPQLNGIKALAIGTSHCLALGVDGAPVSWGNNANGQLGTGSAIIRLWPELTPVISGVVSAAPGLMHSMVVKNDGTLWEWGDRNYAYSFALGAPASVPSQVAGISNVVLAAEGAGHSYALTSDGTVWSWGGDPQNLGVLGQGPAIRTLSSPQPIAGLSGIKSILSGPYFGAALSDSGEVWTWGQNLYGQLGDGTLTNRDAPVRVPGLQGVKAIASGKYHMLALLDDGTVWSWGSNGNRRLGDGTTTSRATPGKVPVVSGITAIATSDIAGLALKSDGTVWGWGGDFRDFSAAPGLFPAQVPGLTGIRSIWAGDGVRFVQRADNSVWVWGASSYGNLGDSSGSLFQYDPPVRVANLPADVTSISGLLGHTLAVTSAGELWSWGYVPSAQMSDAGDLAPAPQLVANSGSYALSSSEIVASSAAGSQSVSLSTGNDVLPWAAVPDSAWLSATPGAGNGSATLTLNWPQNQRPESRIATIRVGGEAVIVTQAGTGPTYSISGTVRANGAGVPGVAVTLSASLDFASSQPSSRISKLTDSSGHYEFTTLTAGGSFYVTPIANTLRFTPDSASAGPLAANQILDFTVFQEPTTLAVDRTSLQFASNQGRSIVTPPQELTVRLTGGAPLVWNAVSSKPWLTVTPSTGSASGKALVSLVSSNLPKTGADSATITITTPNLPNGAVTVKCTLTIAGAATAPPYGSFDTPGKIITGLSGGIAVTGWALDDLGVQSVKIWRDRIGSEQTYPNGLVYIGDALFVPGARPDVEAAHPTRPANYTAGWGYMMLSNALPKMTPSGTMGSGTYRLHAIATDVEGQSATIGTKTITVDNRGSSKPFGAVDAPAPGATIEGAAYPNSGWALTPQPDLIPIDGSTFGVYVDGVNLGKPVYNQFRPDVAGIFPGLANSAGSGGSYVLDTTKLSNGMHSIAWSVADDKGHIDGIGSRFFHILNSGSTAAIAAPMPQPSPMLRAIRRHRLSAETAGYRTGYDAEAPLVPLPADAITVAELERLELHLPPAPEGAIWSAALRVGEELRPLPIGSTFDAEACIFYWQLGPGFLGEFALEFRSAPDSAPLPVRIRVAAWTSRTQ
ncbi:MAG: hypothetical protein IPP47_19410 [Bryobacterales bacterium]|nr:hypothetical protein [Bryobacterales bacterium]